MPLARIANCGKARLAYRIPRCDVSVGVPNCWAMRVFCHLAWIRPYPIAYFKKSNLQCIGNYSIRRAACRKERKWKQKPEPSAALAGVSRSVDVDARLALMAEAMGGGTTWQISLNAPYMPAIPMCAGPKSLPVACVHICTYGQWTPRSKTEQDAYVSPTR
jgi:hypothetical protein